MLIHRCKALSAPPQTSDTSSLAVFPFRVLLWLPLTFTQEAQSAASSGFPSFLWWGAGPRVGQAVHSGWKDTLNGDLWFREPELERMNVRYCQKLALSKLTHALHHDRCSRLGCSLDMCTAEAFGQRAWSKRSQCNNQECHRISSRSSLEPPGQKA